MSILNTEAIVLRTRRFSETSLIATLLSRDHGRLDVLAKGARRDKSPLFGHLDLYQREAVLIHQRPNSGLDLLTEAAFVDENVGLRFFPPAFAAAGLLAELAAEASFPGEPLPELYSVLAQSLAMLARLGEPAARAGLARASGFDPEEKRLLAIRTLRFALLDMLAWLGFGLELRRCVLCGRTPSETDASALSVQHGGLVCRACRVKAAGAVAIAPETLRAFRERGGEEAPEPSPGEGRRWLRFLVEYCQHAIERPLRGGKVLFQVLG